MSGNKIKASARSLSMNYAIRELAAVADQYEAQGMKITRLNIGDPNKWDFETPEYFKEALRRAVDHVDNGYGDSLGDPSFREAIVQREKDKHGTVITADNVFVTQGVGEAINLLMGTFVEQDDEILLPGPGYTSYNQYVHFYGGKPVPYRMIEEEAWRPDIDMMRQRITDRTKAIVIINPNNPTGAVFDKKDLHAVGDLAAEFGIPVISDEIYDKITFGKEYYSMSRLPGDVPRIILNGFSKVNLMPGWRIGYGYFMDSQGILDEIKEGLKKQLRARICPNVPCQWAAKASLQGPQDYIVDLNRRLKDRAEFSYRRLNEIPGIKVNKIDGAFYMFPKILDMKPWGGDDRKFVLDVLKETGVLLVNGSSFDEEFGGGHFRTITLPKTSILADAYEKLEKFMVKRVG